MVTLLVTCLGTCVVATPAHAGDGLFRRLKQRARDSAAAIRERASEARSRVGRSAELVRDRAQEARSQIGSTIERVQERGRETRERAHEAITRARAAASRAGTASARAAERCIETIAQPAKRKAFVDRATPIAQELAVEGIKLIPIYDPDTGDVVSLDNYMRSMLSDMGGDALNGSDLADDPLRTGLLLMMDSDSLDTLRIIQDPASGEWISLEQAAMRVSVPRAHVARVRRATENCRIAYSSGDASAARVAVSELEEALASTPSRTANATSVRVAPLADTEGLVLADSAYRGIQGLLRRETNMDGDDAENAALAILALLAASPPFVLGRMSKRRRITVVAREESGHRSRRRARRRPTRRAGD